MTLKITAFQNGLSNLSAGMSARVGKVVQRTAQEVAASAKEKMAEGKSGRRYGDHTASAPGEAPAIDSGNLAASIQIEPDGDLRAIIVVGAEYGPHLEYGTSRMAARPFLTPAMEEARPGFEKAIAEALIP